MSEWKRAAAARRDERDAKVCIRPPSGKRNTRRWCRGVVGREHAPQCVTYNDLKCTTIFPDWKVLVCTTCNKQLDSYWPSRWSQRQQPPPAWVTNG